MISPNALVELSLNLGNYTQTYTGGRRERVQFERAEIRHFRSYQVSETSTIEDDVSVDGSEFETRNCLGNLRRSSVFDAVGLTTP